MKSYLVTYDLTRPGTNYSDLIEYLKSFPKWCHAEKSVWVVKTDLACTTLRDKLWTYMDGNDKLLVVDVTGDTAAWHGLPQEISNWLKQNL